MEKIFKEIISLLKTDQRFVSEDFELLKNKVIESAINLDSQLLSLLLSHQTSRQLFFVDAGKVTVFDKEKFIKLVNNKQFLPDSYTSYKNKIGLTSHQEYLAECNDVVLAWPYKDCVLEGDQTNDETKRAEVFWNETLAPDEVDRLFEPKVLTSFKRFDLNGNHPITELSFSDNLVIKGNNLLALYSLKKIYLGKVKQIYIDPPYNTGNDSFKYNDSFNHSTWLTFMKNRLEVAKTLLTPDGSIWVNIDDDEAHYLKVLMDEIFGRENFIANLIWEKKYTSANDATYFSDNHDHILVYAKVRNNFRLNKLPRTAKMDKAYSNPDNHPKGPWKSTPLHAKSGSAKSQHFSYTFKNGVTWSPPPGTYPRFSIDKLMEMDENNEIWFGKKGDATPSRKTFLSGMDDFSITPKTIFSYDEVGHNHEAKDELKRLLNDNLFETPKPERLMERILHLGSKKADIVLDFFFGSGTTGAVALKMGRQFIGIEQMDYVESVTLNRLIAVIKGEQGGVSQQYNWQGGGSVIYSELYKLNQAFLEQINAAANIEDLKKIWQGILATGFITYKADIQAIDIEGIDFLKLSNVDQKRILCEVLDKNQLYLAYSEIDDLDFQITTDDKLINALFYRLHK